MYAFGGGMGGGPLHLHREISEKKVPVYMIQLRSKKISRLDPDEDVKDVKNKGKAKYIYTCIFSQFGAKNGRILSQEEAEKKQKYLSQDRNKVEIGIAGFMDTILQIRLRKKVTKPSSHVVAIRTGKVGRLRKRKWSMMDDSE